MRDIEEVKQDVLNHVKEQNGVVNGDFIVSCDYDPSVGKFLRHVAIQYISEDGEDCLSVISEPLEKGD